MSTPNNPVVNQQPRAITLGEVQYFLTDVLKKTSEQFHPGKLVINSTNSDAIQLWLRENDQMTLTVTKALLDAHNYAQAVRTLVTGYVKAVRAMMFDTNSKIQWEKEHPAVTKRRALEAEQRGEGKRPSNDQAQSAFANKVAKAEADAAFEKQEKRYEKDVLDLIDRIFFVNPRTQTRDARKIEELQKSLRADIEKARQNDKSWGKIHAYVVTKIDQAYAADERERVRINSR